MNIDEYLALKAQESTETQAEETVETTETQIEEQEVETPAEQEEVVETPAKIVIDGKEYDADRIKELEQGYSRTQDYTQKTQEAARIRRENQEAIDVYQRLSNNPRLVESLLRDESVSDEDKQILSKLTPAVKHASQIERELNDLRLQRDISALEQKYPGFDAMGVLKFAYDNQMHNLEDAYLLYNARNGNAVPTHTQPAQEAKPAEPVDVEKLRAEIRAEIEASIQAERASTQSIVTAKGATPQAKPTIELSPAQDRVRKMQGLTVEEYMKYLN